MIAKIIVINGMIAKIIVINGMIAKIIVINGMIAKIIVTHIILKCVLLLDTNRGGGIDGHSSHRAISHHSDQYGN